MNDDILALQLSLVNVVRKFVACKATYTELVKAMSLYEQSLVKRVADEATPKEAA